MKYITKLIKIIILSLILINVVYLLAVANFSKELTLIRHNINASDIIFKYETDPFRHINDRRVSAASVRGESIFFIYKNQEELGFARMTLSSQSRLFPVLLPRIERYLLTSKYVINIETGRVEMMQMYDIPSSIFHYYRENVKEDDVKIRSSYRYIYFIESILSDIGGNRIQVFTGIKHEYDSEMMDNTIYKFIEYFDDIFGGIYVYFYTIPHDFDVYSFTIPFPDDADFYLL